MMFLKKFSGFFLSTIFIICFSNIWAQSLQTTQPNEISLEAPGFDIQNANQTLDKLTLQLSVEELNIDNLNKAAEQLTLLRNQAKQCVDTSTSEINKTNQLWEEASTESKESAEMTSVQKYLQEKKSQLGQKKSECQLFVLRSTDAISAFTTTSEKLQKAKLLKPEPNFWKKMAGNIRFTKELHQAFDKNLFIQASGFQFFNQTLIYLLISLLVVSAFFGIYLNRLIKKLQPENEPINIGVKIRLILIKTLDIYLTPLLCALVFSVYELTLSFINHQITLALLFSAILFGFILILTVVHFFFTPLDHQPSILDLHEKIATGLRSAIDFFIILCFIGSIIYLVFYHQDLPDSITNLTRTIFITLLAISMIHLLWLINYIPKYFRKHHSFRQLTSTLSTLFLLSIITAEWLGYQQLVTFILEGILLSLITLFTACLLHKIIISLLNTLNGEDARWQKVFREQLGLKPYYSFPEHTWLCLLTYIFIWGSFILLMLKIWGLPQSSFSQLISLLMHGFKIADFDIIPSRILSAFILFIIMFILVRWIRSSLERRKDPHSDAAAQQAFAAIVGYIGFSLTFIIALLIAGLNFKGIALIAGALSVGIGFGLQNIVNNFVSGIILLVERPIKPGDRIIVGETEGFVKKISIRATRIKTLQFADVIVPNADIISSPVTNLMFRDNYTRIDLEVGVAYGTNTELVKELLLAIAKNHKEIISEEGPYQPWVFFTEFADSSLKFKLYCVIKNINLKAIVKSDLYFAVDKTFRENNICIAYPQQDIHIKDWPGAPLTK